MLARLITLVKLDALPCSLTNRLEDAVTRLRKTAASLINQRAHDYGPPIGGRET